MTYRMAVLGVALCPVLLGATSPTLAAEAQLHIPHVFQERPTWCWAAVAEMVFKYYYVPETHRTDYQCGIAQSSKLCKETSDCLQCAIPAHDEGAMVDTLERYPLGVAADGVAGEIALTAQVKEGNLSEEEVKQELDAGRPIIVGLSPTGFMVDGTSHHLALIVGYDEGPGYLRLTVNDPFPFEDDRFMWIGNPYPVTRASGGTDGRYEIGYEKFQSKLKWTRTIYRITCTGRRCPSETAAVADGPAVKDDGEVIQAVLTASSGDFETLRKGHKAVDGDGATTWLSRVTFSGATQCLIRDKDHRAEARWSCIFKFDERAEADNAVLDIVGRLRKSLPEGWTGTDRDEDTDFELYTRTDKFSAHHPGSDSAFNVYMMDTKKDGRVVISLSVDKK